MIEKERSSLLPGIHRSVFHDQRIDQKARYNLIRYDRSEDTHQRARGARTRLIISLQHQSCDGCKHSVTDRSSLGGISNCGQANELYETRNEAPTRRYIEQREPTLLTTCCRHPPIRIVAYRSGR